ncbi:MAG: TonB-dependent receptor [Novosphingobium sp.]
MRNNSSLALASISAIAFVSVAGMATPAFGQQAPAAGEDAKSSEDIIVTGTLIRGIAPVGSQSIGVSQEKIISIGAANTSDLVSSIPQAGTFNGYVGVRGSSNFSLAVNRPTLRYLGNTASSTASTLLLLDGHRMPGMGILQTSADVDAIAAGAIERVEVVTDGGSSTYGSDAVGGVMNFITRKSFDGVELKDNFGFGDNYQQANVNATVGKTWDWGSAYVTYDFSRHDALYGKERGWSQSLDWVATAANNNIPVGSSFNCTPGNVVISSKTFSLNPISATASRCDNTELATFYPRETKHSLLGSLVIDTGGRVQISLKAYYVHRVDTSDGGPITADVTVTPASPFYIPAANLPGTGLSGNETFRINLASALGTFTPAPTTMEAFGIIPSIKVDLGHDWQVNASVDYGRGKANFFGQANPINTAVLNAGAAAGTFDPRNPALASNAPVITSAIDLFQFGRAVNELVDARAVVDGPLFKLPGGDLRAAIGVEFEHDSYAGITTRGASRAAIAALTDTIVKRDIWSAFGEVNLPIIGADNRGGIYGLSVTASARYDHYSDFGHTFNPKFGINFQPVDWLTLRGNWGKAFQAPGLSDLAQATAQSVNPLPTTLRPFFDPNTPVLGGSNHTGFLVAFGGTLPGLQPQKATTWSLGFDIRPPATGLTAGMTYYNINFKGLIGFAPINLPTFYKNFADKVVLYTAGDAAMQAYFNQLAANLPGGLAGTAAQNTLASIGGNFSNVYAVMDGRTTNLGTVLTDGIDFYVHYSHETGFGDVYAAVDGTYILSLKQGGTTGVADVNGVDPNNKFKVNTTLGAHVGNFQGQVTWAHNSGMAEGPSAANLQQSYVIGFNVFNLFFKYNVPGESPWLKDLSFTVNVDNVLDTDPPLYRGLSNSLFGAANGFTLGRVIKIGVSKKF